MRSSEIAEAPASTPPLSQPIRKARDARPRDLLKAVRDTIRVEDTEIARAPIDRSPEEV